MKTKILACLMLITAIFLWFAMNKNAILTSIKSYFLVNKLLYHPFHQFRT